jgi:hypothetical protein
LNDTIKEQISCLHFIRLLGYQYIYQHPTHSSLLIAPCYLVSAIQNAE